MAGVNRVVEGTHRPRVSPELVFWAALSALSLVLGAANAVKGSSSGVWTSALLTVAGLVNLWRVRIAGQTVITPDGLRVRRGRGWRDLGWGEVASIERTRNIFGLDTGVRVRTEDGEVVVVSISPGLCDELAAYARAHRSRRPPGSDPLPRR